jgi:hypothetical protein
LVAAEGLLCLAELLEGLLGFCPCFALGEVVLGALGLAGEVAEIVLDVTIGQDLSGLYGGLHFADGFFGFLELGCLGG